MWVIYQVTMLEVNVEKFEIIINSLKQQLTYYILMQITHF